MGDHGNPGGASRGRPAVGRAKGSRGRDGNRAGILFAASSLVVSALGLRRELPTELGVPAILAVTLGSLAGVAALLMCRLLRGPNVLELQRLVMAGTPASEGDLLNAKLLTVDANSRAITRAETMFYIQALATVAGVLLLLFDVR